MAGGIDEDTVKNKLGCLGGGNDTSSSTIGSIQRMKRKNNRYGTDIIIELIEHVTKTVR